MPASNIGGAATLIGDPPNIIIASRAGLTFNDFLVHMAPITVIVFIAFVLLARVLFRSSFRYDERYAAEVMSLDERKAITDPALLTRCLIVLGLVIVGFSLHSGLHVEPSIVALVGAGVMLLVSRVEVSDVLEEVEWPVLVFFMGLFVMVAALGHTGVIERIGTWSADAVGDDYFGGNGTAVAASANVVAIGIAAKTGNPISFWQFTRYGMVVTVLSTLMAWVYVALRYF
ncbi:SLC13 family permease [Actinomadura coerulea]|uniref:SLC13 family permease n=1 Tax=Actinomadura coerulea TaxID=46159 RepID=UPI0034123063